MKSSNAIFLALSFCLATMAVSSTQAQTEGLGDVRGNKEALRMGLYPPDIIMKHQQRLGITGEQRRSILKAVQKFQAEVADLQWTLQNDQQLLQQSLAAYPVEAPTTLRQAEKVLELESRFKLAHFKLLVAIKNELMQEQVDMLNRTIRERMGKKRS
ncbi:MAG: hypothetical protein ACI9B9_000554 [Halioglobus sp.]|jgi:hypothetical protein